MAGFARKCPCLRPKMEAEVRVLDYRHSSLRDVPVEVFNRERTLEELYADSNQIRDLPRELFYCHGLRKLCVSDNEITSIPPAISSLANLEELDFSKNGVIDVPENIKACKYLRSIDASVNPLGKLPEGFTQLANLTHLYLNDTFLDYLPGSFGRMTKLRILEMRENHLKTLPRSFSRLTTLERLDIGNNEFTELSDVIGGLTNLLELWCDNNQITTISSSIGQLKQLMFLDASKNQLQELPPEIEGCSSLADLHLTSNCLIALPDSIGNLNNLTTLKADDNQLTSLPKTIGGLSSLSELNVSANDLEDLPASIGLLRNVRTFYADENLLQHLPAELGSCNGITVLSLRSNKLTYIPDEIGRIPRLRVLNLSDNRLQCLPFTIVKLKELQALWLTENQTRPLIPLQSEHEPDTGRKILTCYLLPQGELEPNDERDPNGDTASFHASMWDEERLRRQQIHFDFGDDSEEEGTLVRCPTPYPKEMRAKVRHARNLAMRQMVGGAANKTDTGGVTPGGPAGDDAGAGAAVSGDRGDTDGGSREMVTMENGEEGTPQGFGYSKMGDRSDVRIREARITSSNSPSSPTHKLYRADKEKLMKDKARMQHRMSVPDFTDVTGLIKEQQDDSFRDQVDSSRMVRRSGSVPDLSMDPEGGHIQGSNNNSISDHQPPRAATFDELYYKHIGFMGGHQHHSRHHHRHGSHRRGRRSRGYDSDTGYRSDREIYHRSSHRSSGNKDGGGSEVLSVRSQPTLRRSHKDGGYASDVGPYNSPGVGTLFPTANAAAAAFQQNRSFSQRGSNSDLLFPQTALSSSTPPVGRAAQRAQTPTNSHPVSSDYSYYHHHHHRNNQPQPQQQQAQQPFRKVSSGGPYDWQSDDTNINQIQNSNLNSQHLPSHQFHNSNYYHSEGSSNTFQPQPLSSSSSSLSTQPQQAHHPMYTSSSPNKSHSQPPASVYAHHHHSAPTTPSSSHPPAERLNSHPDANHHREQQSQQQQHQQHHYTPDSSHTGYGGPRPPVAPKPKLNLSQTTSLGLGSPGFHSNGFIDQSTPKDSTGSHGIMSGETNSPRDARGIAISWNQALGMPNHQAASTPPPYTPAPPYQRRPSDPMGMSGSPRPRLPSDASSGRSGSGRGISTQSYNPYQQRFAGSNTSLTREVERSQSSPCGFHGSNPYSDLPRASDSVSSGGGRGRPLSRLGGRAAGGGEGRSSSVFQDNMTTHSGSSSSHIGSASQSGAAAGVNHNIYNSSSGGGSGNEDRTYHPGNYNSSNNSSNNNFRPRDRSDSSDSRSDSQHYSHHHHHPLHHQDHDSSNNSYSDGVRHHQLSSSFENGHPHHRGQSPGYYEDLTHIMTGASRVGAEDRGCSQEQSSQVSSSTDSGYGPGNNHTPHHPGHLHHLHSNHVYESIGDHMSKAKGYAGSVSTTGSHGASPNSSVLNTPPSQRQTPTQGIASITTTNSSNKNSGNAGNKNCPPLHLSSSTASSSSREATPIKELSPLPPPAATTAPQPRSRLSPNCLEHRDQFRVTIKKNPGLGFSIAGGIGSHGNPYRPNDIGIFVTKVIPEGPASKLLRPGDKLLEVNKVDFQAVAHHQAVDVLKNSSSVNLLVERLQKVNMV